MVRIEQVGLDFVEEVACGLTTELVHITPSQFNEEHRYLGDSRYPGPLRYDVTPYAKEIVDCLDPDNDVREVNVKKGVQIAYTTAILEAGILFVSAYLKSPPQMYMTADKELAAQRIENNIIPMFNGSGFSDIFAPADIGNTRKTGKTKNHLQFSGGGKLIPYGAKNADKMRQFSAMFMWKDELDGWPDYVGKDGEPDKLSDDRTSAYHLVRKIFRGSTPLIKGNSKIEKRWLEGDQRRYMVRCKACSFPQYLKWEWKNEIGERIGGFAWDYDEDGQLLIESVRYHCKNCGHAHYEHDKVHLLHWDHGAYWEPTAKPKRPGVRSYHIPAMLSPAGMQPWSKSVSDYLAGFDPVTKKVVDFGAYQQFYNNVLGEPFDTSVGGYKITKKNVSNHRRVSYRYGEIPNEYAKLHSGGPVLFLTLQVDVQKRFLAVAVMGWTIGMRCYLIDYWKMDAKKDCRDPDDPVWSELREIIEEKRYTSDDGHEYRVNLALIDARYSNPTVVGFCSEYPMNVYPILGQDRPSKNQRVDEFAEFTTKIGTRGYRITVDHYKDRLAPVLRREWYEGDSGVQREHHFNAPMNITDKQLEQLTKEWRKQKEDDKGRILYYWHRASGAENELWDLLVYGHAAVEIMAVDLWVGQMEKPELVWPDFWAYVQGTDRYRNLP